MDAYIVISFHKCKQYSSKYTLFFKDLRNFKTFIENKATKYLFGLIKEGYSSFSGDIKGFNRSKEPIISGEFNSDGSPKPKKNFHANLKLGKAFFDIYLEY